MVVNRCRCLVLPAGGKRHVTCVTLASESKERPADMNHLVTRAFKRKEREKHFAYIDPSSSCRVENCVYYIKGKERDNRMSGSNALLTVGNKFLKWKREKSGEVPPTKKQKSEIITGTAGAQGSKR